VIDISVEFRSLLNMFPVAENMCHLKSALNHIRKMKWINHIVLIHITVIIFQSVQKSVIKYFPSCSMVYSDKGAKYK